MEIKPEQLDTIATLADSMANIEAALKLPMPPEHHLEQVKQCLAAWQHDLKGLYIDIANDDPWAT